MKNLQKIGELLRTQDNRITDQPIFIVEQKTRDYGYSHEYSDYYEWIDLDNGGEAATKEEVMNLDDLDAHMEPVGNWQKVYYMDRWEFVTSCFTEQGCKDYLKANSHNLKETRIFAAGSFRNEEFQGVRKWLMNSIVCCGLQSSGNWCEDDHDCIFFNFPSFEEPPEVYCGSPLETDFNHEHWTHFIKIDFNEIIKQAIGDLQP